MAGTPVSDRTEEFRGIVAALSRHQPAAAHANDMVRPRTRSEFTKMTSKIGADIYATTQKLEKLSQLAQSTSLFDDPTVEINELTMIIKQSLASLNAQLKEVQEAMRLYKSRASGSGDHQESHTRQIVEALQLQLSATAKGFQDVLHTRSQNIQVQMSRQRRFDGGISSRGQAQPALALGDSLQGAGAPLFTPPQRHPVDEESEAQDTVIDIGNVPKFSTQLGGEAQVQVQHMMPSNYLESRANAVESVQSTIVELGNIFQQLQTVVAEQQLMVERIDGNVEDTVATVESTQRQLVRMYQNLSGNRLAMKVVAMVVFFLMLYGFLVA